jgi:predicted MPP superfamily phosphohydrolase
VNLKTLFWTAVGVSAGALTYGALVESNRLVVLEKDLILDEWPERLSGYKIAVLGDFHLRDVWSMDVAKRAVDAALDSNPDMVVLVGDFVGRWKPDSVAMIGEILEPLLLMQGNVVAIPGNHEYIGGDVSALAILCNELNIKLLRNESWVHHGIQWVGIDSANAGQADPIQAIEHVDFDEPVIALWHEPDMVDWLPEGVDLMVSGHSHGGQFLMPWGTPFMTSENGRRYRKGYYPDATTPIFVTSGVGTTGPPSRLFCPPEVAVLTLW